MEATSYFDIGIHIKAEGFAAYLNALNASLETQRASLEAVIEQESAGADDETRDIILDRHIDEWHHLAVVFPQRFFNTFVVSLCSWLESELNDLAVNHRRGHPDALQLGEVAGKGLARAQLYLKRIVGVAFPDDRGAWSVLRSLYNIRNEIIHKDAASTGLADPELKLLAQYDCAGADGVERIALTLSFCRMALEKCRSFFGDLDAVLPEELRNW
jgi:hypothetical protein